MSFNNVNNYTETEINNLTAQFRVNRNKMLAKTDQIVISDRMPDERWTPFRQKLRDIPQLQPNYINGLDDDYFTQWEWDKFLLLGAGMVE